MVTFTNAWGYIGLIMYCLSSTLSQEVRFLGVLGMAGEYLYSLHCCLALSNHGSSGWYRHCSQSHFSVFACFLETSLTNPNSWVLIGSFVHFIKKQTGGLKRTQLLSAKYALLSDKLDTPDFSQVWLMLIRN